MPRVPKWLANGMERVFSGMMHPVEVTEIDDINSQLKRVRFEGDLSQTKFEPGNVIEFRISDTEFRHYTPSFYSKTQGICEVLFYVHGFGPGSAWVEQLQKGYHTKLMGPGGKMHVLQEAQHHFCFGDESSLGLCKMVQSTAQQISANFYCLLELEPEHKDWPKAIELSAEILGKSIVHPAQEAIHKLRAFTAEEWQNLEHTIFYLTGRAKSIQAFRKFLIDKGINRKHIQSFAYWADGKKGL